jgi:RNase P subunit RPR2
VTIIITCFNCKEKFSYVPEQVSTQIRYDTKGRPVVATCPKCGKNNTVTIPQG